VHDVAPHVVEAGVRALRAGLTRYGPPAGIPELRAAVADALRARGVPADPARVVVSPGAKAMIFTTLLAAVRPGDEVLVPDPGYPAYASVTEFAGGRAVRYRLRADRGFALDPDAVAARCTPRTRVLVLNTPHNPTGAVVDAPALARLAALAVERDLLVVSDEIYARHVYDGPADGPPGARPGLARAGIAALPGMAERTVVIDGFSKAYAMTGWRLGYGLLPAALVGPVTALLANSASCTATFVQHAGVAALTGPQDLVAEQAAEFRRRRDRLVAALNQVDGVRCATPGGAFYVFPDVAGVLAPGGGPVAAGTTEALARWLLERHGVALVPGTAFGPAGLGHLRLAYTAPPADLDLAVARLRAGVAEWRAEHAA
jgi:aspartate/methionine/tyrosine aminotransferase